MGDLYERWSADDGFLHVRPGVWGLSASSGSFNEIGVLFVDVPLNRDPLCWVFIRRTPLFVQVLLLFCLCCLEFMGFPLGKP